MGGGAPQKYLPFCGASRVDAPQKVGFLWRMRVHAPQKSCGSHVQSLGLGPSGQFLWRTAAGAPQKVHILWRTELRAPQNVGPDPQKGGNTHFPHVTFFILPPMHLARAPPLSHGILTILLSIICC